MGIELSAAAVLHFKSTPKGLHYTLVQSSYVPIETNRNLNTICAKSINGPCRKIQRHYLLGLLTNIKHKVMNHLFTPL